MGKAGKALKRVLEGYGISQNRLAVLMGVDRANVNRWVHEVRDPAAEVVFQIRQTLETIDPAAAEAFVRFYFYDAEELEK